MADLAFRSAASANGSGATVVVSKPAGAVDGDLLVCVMTSANSSSSYLSHTLPSGFTALDSTGSGTNGRVGLIAATYAVRMTIGWKIASSEPSTYTFTASGSSLSLAGGIAAYDNPLVAGAYDKLTLVSGSGSPTSLATLTTAEANELLVGLIVNNSGGSPSTFSGTNLTERLDFSNIFVGDTVQASAGASGAKAVTCTISGDYIGYLLAFKSEAAGGTTTAAGASAGTGTATGVGHAVHQGVGSASASSSAAGAASDGTAVHIDTTQAEDDTFSASAIDGDTPAGVLDGDLLIAAFTTATDVSRTHTTPTGWTVATTQERGIVSGFFARATIYYRIADSEPSATTFVVSNFGAMDIKVSAYRNINAVPFDAVAAIIDGSGASIAMPEVTTTSDNDLLYGYVYSDGGGGARTFTTSDFAAERADAGNVAVYDSVQSTAGASGSKTVTASGTGSTIAILLAMRSEASGAIDASAASASATSTAAAAGAALNAAAGSASGTGSAAAVGNAIKPAAGSAGGTSTVAAVGSGGIGSIGAASGVAAAAGVGASIISATGSASAAATASAQAEIGQSFEFQQAILDASPAVGAAAGTGTATAGGRAVKPMAGAASGQGAATGAGASTARAAGSAAGTSTAIGYSEAGVTVGLSTGTSSASAVGRATAAATGVASAAGSVAGAAGGAASSADGTASSSSVASAVAQVLAAAVGAATGAGTASGRSPLTTPNLDTFPHAADITVGKRGGTISIRRHEHAL